MDDIIGLKQLRQSMEHCIRRVRRGRRLLVVRRSEPIFKIVPVDDADGEWEEVVDFTNIRRGGVDITAVLSRL